MIYIDASRYSEKGKRTGVENYSYFLINELVTHHADEIVLISPRSIPIKGVKKRVIWFPRLWTQFRLSLEVFFNRKIKTLFIPSHVMPLIHPKKTIITIHDVAFRRYPEAYSKLSRWYLDWSTKFAIDKAYRIIVPSETTKKDLIKFYQADEKKVSVIPLGFKQQNLMISPQQTDFILQDYNLKKNQYFLFVGRVEAKKNIKTLVQAFEKLSEEYPDYKLVLAGKPGIGYESQIPSSKSPIRPRAHGREEATNQIVMTGYVSEEEKWALLEQATCFVFPSLFEGFGLPLLEAMSAKTPLIVSNIPSSHEVMGNLPVYFDPENADELAHRMKEVIKHPELMKRLVNSYSDRLAQFTWEKCAEETWKILTS